MSDGRIENGVTSACASVADKSIAAKMALVSSSLGLIVDDRADVTRADYWPALPVKPIFCNAAKTSASLKSPVTVKDLAFFTALLVVTPGTSAKA